jgi:nitrite reductase/ring-hydroxylating ferredoxin subunit/uncharacterized membrane protein
VVSAPFQDPALRPVKTFLNGTWLEHPLHPVLTDLPIGAWTITMCLDLLSLLFGVKRLGRASAITTGLGFLGALGAVVTGLADWMDVDPPELAVGSVHAITNITATTLFGVSFLFRRGDRWRVRPRSFVPAMLGYLAVTAGAYIGGSLVYRRGVMVNRDAFRSGPNDFVSVIAFDQLPENTPLRVQADGQPVLLVRRGEQIYATCAVCSHYGGPLDEGQLKDDIVECPWHYSRFSLQDGSVKAGPATAPIPAYDVRISDGQIQVKMRAEE